MDEKKFEMPLDLRVTHRYNADYMDLDEWDNIGTWKVLNSMSQDDGEGVVVITHCQVKSNATKKDIIEALFTQFDKGCSCEHDCCGHLFGGAVDVVELETYDQDFTEWIIKSTYVRNY